MGEFNPDEQHAARFARRITGLPKLGHHTHEHGPEQEGHGDACGNERLRANAPSAAFEDVLLAEVAGEVRVGTTEL